LGGDNVHIGLKGRVSGPEHSNSVNYVLLEGHRKFHLKEQNESLLESCNSETEFLKVQFGLETSWRTAPQKAEEEIGNIKMDHWDVMELAKDCVQWWVLV
jgi:hypothetical protein